MVDKVNCCYVFMGPRPHLDAHYQENVVSNNQTYLKVVIIGTQVITCDWTIEEARKNNTKTNPSNRFIKLRN